MVPKREAVALESPDGYSDGYNPDDIKADILGPKGERVDYYNAQIELNLPIYLVHDVQSCVDLQMNIWGKMKDADYSDYVVKADLNTADGKECQLPDVGVYSTKYLAEKISKDMRFPVACSSVTVACDLVTAGLFGPWGLDRSQRWAVLVGICQWLKN